MARRSDGRSLVVRQGIVGCEGLVLATTVRQRGQERVALVWGEWRRLGPPIAAGDRLAPLVEISSPQRAGWHWGRRSAWTLRTHSAKMREKGARKSAKKVSGTESGVPGILLCSLQRNDSVPDTFFAKEADVKLRVVWQVIKTAALDWQRDRSPRLGAAISYYAIFSIAPVLVIAISIAGTVFGEEQAQEEVFTQVNRFLGNEAAAHAVKELVRSAARPRTGNLATALSIVALWFGASGLFTQLKAALNDVWEVERKPHAGLVAMLIEYVWSVAMVLAVGLLLLFSLVVSSVITAVSAQAEGALPIPDSALQAVDWGISIVFLTVLFAAIFKFLPDVIVAWRDVWVGAVVTSVLFTTGKFLIGFYLARSAIASAYGAAGSFILLLVWTYYSTQIVLFGAEITQAYARQVGSPVFPKERAQFVASAVKPDRHPASKADARAARSKSA